MSSELDIVSAFVEGAPPGEVSPAALGISAHDAVIKLTPLKLADVVAGDCAYDPSTLVPKLTLRLDIKALNESNPDIISELGPAFQKYNEEQFTTVKLPGSSQPVSV